MVKMQGPIQKITNRKKGSRVAQVLEHEPSEHETQGQKKNKPTFVLLTKTIKS
jgi:hypothetical protein